MKPILFNTDMVRAILEGRKTVTRRLVKEPYYVEDGDVSTKNGLATHKGEKATHGMPYPARPYETGDILYVRETWRPVKDSAEVTAAGRCVIQYRAGGLVEFDEIITVPQRNGETEPWRPAIHMPKSAARLFLWVTDVRVERLKDITSAEIAREGVEPKRLKKDGCRCSAYTGDCMDEPCPNRDAYEYLSYAIPFAGLWNSTIKAADRGIYGWEADPWVWVIEFERIEGGLT